MGKKEEETRRFEDERKRRNDDLMKGNMNESGKMIQKGLKVTSRE
jgi:hypothetical protein